MKLKGYIDVGDGSCFCENFKRLLTVSAILVTNILYLIASSTNIQKISPRSNSVTNVVKFSPTVSHQHYDVGSMTVAN